MREVSGRKHTRRGFLWRAIPGIAVAGATLTVLRPLLSYQGKAGLSRSYTAGKYGVELDGQFAGWIESAEGGHATSDVVPSKFGPGSIPRKQIAGVKYEDITVNCGTGMSRNFYDWIKASLDKPFVRKNGAIVTCDFDYRQLTRMEWSNALITEIGFPACDAASKDAARMTIKFAPGETRHSVFTSGQQGAVYQPSRMAQMVQKKWLPANFRLNIAGLDCSHVNKIEAITARFADAANQSVAVRSPSGAPRMQVSNLAVTLPDAQAGEFYKWHEDFVSKGNNASEKKRAGTLQYLTPNLKESLFTLTFRGLAIFKLTPEKVEAGSENIRRVKAEMLCEDIAFAHGTAAWA